MVPPLKCLHTREGVWRESLARFLGRECAARFRIGEQDVLDEVRVQARVCWHVRASIDRVGVNSRYRAALRAAFNAEHDTEIIRCATTKDRLAVNHRRGGLSASTTNTQLSAVYVEALAGDLGRADLRQPSEEEFAEEVRVHTEHRRQLDHERLAGGPGPAAWHVESPRDRDAAEGYLPRTLLYFATTPVKELVTIATEKPSGLPAFFGTDRHYLPAFTDESLYRRFWEGRPERKVLWCRPGHRVLTVLRGQDDLGLAVNQLANGTQGGWYWNAKELRDL